MFKLLKQSKKSQARWGELNTRHGKIQTPFFLPIASKGSIKALDAEDIQKAGAQIVLANVYHLYLQPGLSVIKKFGGLHKFMNWHGPILTDSGGYQVFSLSEKTRKGKSLRSLKKDGVKFQSFLNGSKHLFAPEKVQQIQDIIGSDIKMVLDVCSPYPCSKKQAEKDLALTHYWAEKSLRHHKKSKSKNLLFGIMQGSIYKDLRLKSIKGLLQIEKDFSAKGRPLQRGGQAPATGAGQAASGWDGLAIGGLAVGEPEQKMYTVLDYLIDYLPKNKPRYLMGIGKPEQIVQTVKRGVDMFDCVIPTREARHGRLYVKTQNSINRTQKFYKVINITNSKYKNSTQRFLGEYTLGYLHHLFKANEPLGLRLASLNNLYFYLELFRKIRQDI